MKAYNNILNHCKLKYFKKPFKPHHFNLRITNFRRFTLVPSDDDINETKSIRTSSEVEHAVISVFELFSIGIGPSSSHTVGPMRAAKKFVDRLKINNKLTNVKRLDCELYGSLALTGVGHGTDYAILMGLEGNSPENVDPTTIPMRTKEISKSNKLNLNNEHLITFEPLTGIKWYINDVLPFHSNGLRLIAFDNNKNIIQKNEYYSIGGGFVVVGDPSHSNAFRMFDKPVEGEELKALSNIEPKYKFSNAKELEHLCWALDMSISDIVLQNELEWKTKEDIEKDLLKIWKVMNECIENGLNTKGLLNTTTRRAMKLAQKIQEVQAKSYDSPLSSIDMKGNFNDDWLRVWAISVNEENSSGNRVVTAPTNGAAGVIPAVIKYYTTFHKNPTSDGITKMLLTAGAIGMLYKRGASLSAAEVGCQGEIGVASSMAAAALCEAMGGNIFQVTNAAEIAMEHSLGLTCDPVGGYVEIPCIERNAIGASKAVAAARMALMGDGKNVVSLDNVIKTMKQTGIDMQAKYKETSTGGLAQNVPYC